MTKESISVLGNLAFLCIYCNFKIHGFPLVKNRIYKNEQTIVKTKQVYIYRNNYYNTRNSTHYLKMLLKAVGSGESILIVIETLFFLVMEPGTFIIIIKKY